MSNGEITAKSYTLRTETGQWLGQVVLTSDGAFMSITDYGNLSFAWRHTGMDDFKDFILGLNIGYFSTKMYTGLSYIVYGKKFEKACDRFAEKILPVLQKVLAEEKLNSEQNVQVSDTTGDASSNAAGDKTI